MAPVIDYLAEELKREEAKATKRTMSHRAAKRERFKQRLNDLKSQPEVVDYLTVMGD